MIEYCDSENVPPETLTPAPFPRGDGSTHEGKFIVMVEVRFMKDHFDKDYFSPSRVFAG